MRPYTIYVAENKLTFFFIRVYSRLCDFVTCDCDCDFVTPSTLSTGSRFYGSTSLLDLHRLHRPAARPRLQGGVQVFRSADMTKNASAASSDPCGRCRP